MSILPHPVRVFCPEKKFIEYSARQKNCKCCWNQVFCPIVWVFCALYWYRLRENQNSRKFFSILWRHFGYSATHFRVFCWYSATHFRVFWRYSVLTEYYWNCRIPKEYPFFCRIRQNTAKKGYPPLCPYLDFILYEVHRYRSSENIFRRFNDGKIHI